jgi:ppGpp synthetase/RelA/SpoT-type nucleotidyltranferase
MALVDDFISQYRREYDFYDQTARLAAQMLDSRLQAAGIRSIVTSRAKSVARLGPKVAERALRKNYQQFADIYDDIVDLAGVRVALYFPGQRSQVDAIVRDIFALNEPPKEFPDGSKPKYEYTKRFSGYSATHYRVHLKDASLSEPQKRYSEARIEIQVASVMMHAWSEVDHDLVYKPLQGMLSTEEYQILDELNGLAIASEIALERLQRAGEHRSSIANRQFRNHYELAAHLLSSAASLLNDSISDAGMGQIDILFDLLNIIGIHTPEQLSRYVAALHSDTEKKPVAQQVVDILLAEDPSRYAVYEELRSRSTGGRAQKPGQSDEPSDTYNAIGSFVSSWADFERVILNKIPPEARRRGSILPTPGVLAEMGLIESDAKNRLEPIRRLRNMVVHSTGPVDLAELQEATQFLRQITLRVLGL